MYKFDAIDLIYLNYKVRYSLGLKYTHNIQIKSAKASFRIIFR